MINFTAAVTWREKVGNHYWKGYLSTPKTDNSAFGAILSKRTNIWENVIKYA